MFAGYDDVLEDGMGSGGSTNPYLNSPPSLPRQFYPRSDDEDEGVDQHQPPQFYSLGTQPRSSSRPSRQRSLSGQPPVERKGGQLVSLRYFTSFGRNVGSRQKEKGESWVRSPLPSPSPLSSTSKFPHLILSIGSDRTTCSGDSAIASTQPQGFSLLLPLPSGSSHRLEYGCENNPSQCHFVDRNLLRSIFFPRTSHVHLEVSLPSALSSDWYAKISHGYPFSARSTALPLVLYRFFLHPTQVRFELPSLTSVPLPCLLRLTLALSILDP